MNDHQGKALREGCHDRDNTKRNLVRATTKSKGRMQTVTNGHVSQLRDELSC